MRPFDPVTTANEVMATLLQNDTFLSALNWKSWENNNPAAAQPRGYVNVTMHSAMVEADLSAAFEFEVVVEAKPQVDLNREMLSTIVGHAIRPDLAAALNLLIPDGSLAFEGKPEGLRLSQSIAGETRHYSTMFTLHGLWNVIYVPG